MAEHCIAVSRPIKDHKRETAVNEQESVTEAQIAARLEYYAPVIGTFKDDLRWMR